VISLPATGNVSLVGFAANYTASDGTTRFLRG
jgi:hypothetical protein